MTLAAALPSSTQRRADLPDARGRRPRAGRALALAAGLAFAVGLAFAASACSGGGGGGGGSGPRGGGGSSAAAGSHLQSGASQQQWAVALQALAQGSATPSLDDQGLRQWSVLIARSWPGIRALVEPIILQQLTQQLAGLAPQGGAVRVAGLRDVRLDLTAPPAVHGDPTGRAAIISMPAAPAVWALRFTVDAEVPVQTTVFGLALSSVIALDVTVRADDLRVVARAEMDLSDPVRPRPIGAQAPQLSVRLGFESASPLLSTVTATLTQVLDPVVRVALLAGAVYAQGQITSLLGMIPVGTPGQGGPALAGVAGAPDLKTLADGVSDEIQRHHFPYATMLTVVFDQPGFGNGTPIDYMDFGDSAIWTGHYLTAEAIRFDLTGDGRALAGATRAIDGLELCLDVPGQGGLLGRYALPVHSPHGSPNQPIGFARGIAWNYGGGISRDQYIGTMMGFVTSYLRVPAFRPRAAALIGRIVDYLDRKDWIAYDTDGVTPSAPFAQTPAILWAFVKAGAMVDPARWGALHDANKDLSKILWIADWGSTREVMESYYKFNLLHSTKMILVSTETDPALYREYVKSLAVAHEVVGHHSNAWFDAVYGIAVPTATAQMGAQVRMELERWTLRDRRSHPTHNSLDPTIAKVFYNSPWLIGNGVGQGSPGFWVSLYPLPIEKRAHGDFLWQTQPFQLDGGQSDPRQQHAGVDLLLPYWAGRAFGLIP